MQYDTVNYLYSISALPKEYQHLRASIGFWEKFDGDFVKKGELLCRLHIENASIYSIGLYAEADGVLEILQYPTNNIIHPIFLSEKDKVFSIYKNADKQKILELKNKRFKNIPIIKLNEFSETKELRWETIAGQKKINLYGSKIDLFDSNIYDSFIFYTNDNNRNKLIFTLNNLNKKDFIVFKYPTKEYKLDVGSKILFLFEDGEILEFEITTKPYKLLEHAKWGHIYETRVQLTTQELEILKIKAFSKWQIEFSKTEKKIAGVIDTSDIQFSINKLAREYHELVQIEIPDYQPLIDKQKAPVGIIPDNDECYLYLMIDLSNNYHKIGISNKPEYREKTLQSEKPTIEMICYKRFPNRKIALSFEQALHQTYIAHRIRGEWFNLNKKDIEDLIQVLKS